MAQPSLVRATGGRHGDIPAKRRSGKVPSYPDHGGLNSGEDTLMAAVAGMVTAPLPKLKRLS